MSVNSKHFVREETLISVISVWVISSLINLEKNIHTKRALFLILEETLVFLCFDTGNTSTLSSLKILCEIQY